MVMGTWKNWSGLAFWEYKDGKVFEGICTVLPRPNATFYFYLLSRPPLHYVKDSKFDFWMSRKHSDHLALSILIRRLIYTDSMAISKLDIRTSGEQCNCLNVFGFPANIIFGFPASHATVLVLRRVFKLDIRISREIALSNIVISMWSRKVCGHC
ncbi:hypothetical protein BJ912DRAFT_1042483 [Pholiota molesta]|nr:hypothetical protein BJ912DRAFT_1042483 [Pholiota molesta]